MSAVGLQLGQDDRRLMRRPFGGEVRRRHTQPVDGRVGAHSSHPGGAELTTPTPVQDRSDCNLLRWVIVSFGLAPCSTRTDMRCSRVCLISIIRIHAVKVYNLEDPTYSMFLIAV